MDNKENKTDNINEESAPKKMCCRKMSNKLHCYDWLADIPESHDDTDLVEVQFKNTRKGYFRNSAKVKIEKGDIVAVESTPGHDIGEVTLTGRLVLLQMKKNGVRLDNPDIKRVYRKAKPNDLEKYEEAKGREHDTMLRARKIAEELNLNMKIGDVEYQGDGNKAIFYYIADDRVDFRQLIKVLADSFRVRIEMKQIGARQEAGRIGGIGPCGRQLCCSSWMSSFVSVATSAARYQDISLNPQKLAGQCAKLKCCLNYEVDAYVEAQKKLPSREVALETKDSTYYHFKTDIFNQEMTYSTGRDMAANLVTISSERVFEVMTMNKKGVRPDQLDDVVKEETPRKDFEDVVGQDSLTRFDRSKRNNNGDNNNNNKRRKKPVLKKPGNGGEGREDNEKSAEPNRRPEVIRRQDRPDNNRRSENGQPAENNHRKPGNGENRNRNNRPSNPKRNNNGNNGNGNNNQGGGSTNTPNNSGSDNTPK